MDFGEFQSLLIRPIQLHNARYLKHPRDMKYSASMSVQTNRAIKVSDVITQNELKLLFPYPHKLLYECFQTFLTLQPKATPF